MNFTPTKERVQRHRAIRAQKRRDNDLLLEEIWAEHDAREMERLSESKRKLEIRLVNVNKAIERLSRGNQ